MASSIPQIYEIYEAKQTDPIMKKNIEKFKGDDYLRNKLTELESVKPTNQKAVDSKEQIFDSVLSGSPQKYMPRNQSLINSITKE